MRGEPGPGRWRQRFAPRQESKTARPWTDGLIAATSSSRSPKTSRTSASAASSTPQDYLGGRSRYERSSEIGADEVVYLLRTRPDACTVLSSLTDELTRTSTCVRIDGHAMCFVHNDDRGVRGHAQRGENRGEHDSERRREISGVRQRELAEPHRYRASANSERRRSIEYPRAIALRKAAQPCGDDPAPFLFTTRQGACHREPVSMNATRSWITGSPRPEGLGPLPIEGGNLAVDPSLVLVGKAANRTAIPDALLIAGHDAEDRQDQSRCGIRHHLDARRERIQRIGAEFEVQTANRGHHAAILGVGIDNDG